MKKVWRIPALETVCLGGFLCVFLVVLFLVLPQLKEILGHFGGKPPYLAVPVLKVYDHLQPTRFAVLLGVAVAVIMFGLSHIWHMCMPEWPWVPVRVILAVGTALVLFVALAISPIFFTICECL